MPTTTHNPITQWFEATNGWQPFPFQTQAWQAQCAGQSGLIHAPTGHGKTHAAWLGPLMRWCDQNPDPKQWPSRVPLTVLWITPLRALAGDTLHALQQPIEQIGLPWTAALRTGDTPSHQKQKQRKAPPSVLVTTPESLTLLLSYADSQAWMKHVQTVVVDEWHELMASKRGTQTELALARLRQWNPSLQTWGLSATLGNLAQAQTSLLGVDINGTPNPGVLISGETIKKDIQVQTIIPPQIDRFPWHGHLGLHLAEQVCDQIEKANTTLVFTNTRSQAELWYAELMKRRPDWLGALAIHHGSLEKAVRDEVEALLDAGRLKAVVCTSSLDLGVDFQPVDQVLQVGSPKGVARLMQRAGRSGHQPGATSCAFGVPAHAFELIEFAAARHAIGQRRIEARVPIDKPLDVLAQHLVTCAMGGGFEPSQLKAEVRTATAFKDLTDDEWQWCLDFTIRGGDSLNAYPQFARIQPPEVAPPPPPEAPSPGPSLEGGETDKTHPHLHTVASRKVAQNHRLGIGTITSDAHMTVALGNGKSLGTVEESFVARLKAGDCFIFAGQLLEFVRARGMVASVRRAKKAKGVVPRWGGGKSPLSTELADTVLELFNNPALHDCPEMQAVQPLLQIQKRWSQLPNHDTLLIETTFDKRGQNWFVFPFAGRLVNEGLATLVGHRLTQTRKLSLTLTHNDYGFQVAAAGDLDLSESDWHDLLSVDQLLEDLLASLNQSQLARRQFREVARVAGLLIPSYPGQKKAARHLQASSDLFFDVFEQFDPNNLLLDQAKREVLDRQLEVRRLSHTLTRLAQQKWVFQPTKRLTPLAFPLWAESIRDQSLSSESWQDRLARMVAELEKAAKIQDKKQGKPL